MSTPSTLLQVESAVKSRYSAAAQIKVEALCCPVEYDRHYLKVIPPEVIERDYGCGDPSKHLRPGETVLDLGSGTGKICFIASQVVGPTGRVIGVDMNDDMLALARRYQRQVGDAIGFHNVEFRKGHIQDLALDLEKLAADLQANPVQGANAFLAVEARAVELRVTHPLIVGTPSAVPRKKSRLRRNKEVHRSVYIKVRHTFPPWGRMLLAARRAAPDDVPFA